MLWNINFWYIYYSILINGCYRLLFTQYHYYRINIILAISLNWLQAYVTILPRSCCLMSIGAYTCHTYSKTRTTFYRFLTTVYSIHSWYPYRIPTLRLMGDYLAIWTLFFLWNNKILVLNIDYIGGAIDLMISPIYELTWFCYDCNYSSINQSFINS